LKDNVTLLLKTNAVILGSTNASDYRNVDAFMAGDGVPLGHALIVADGARNVGIEGSGTIDGRGKQVRAAQKNYDVRPFLLRWLRCTNVTMKDVHLTDPGAWTLNFFQTRTALVERVTIRTRNTGLRNNDGIDLDSCEAIRVRDCDIESGDDALCLKATSPLPCHNIVASGCRLSTKCNAIKLGTESLGNFEQITVTNCLVHKTGMAGIAMYCVDGADMHDVAVGDITMDGVSVPISLRLGARLKTFRAGDQPKSPGHLRDITIRDVSAKGVNMIGMLINGVPGHPLENLTFQNIAIEVPGGGTQEDAEVELAERPAAYPEFSMFGKVLPASGIYARHVRGITFKDVRIVPLKPDARPEKLFVDVEGVVPDAH
jgi:polygalacturonase